VPRKIASPKRCQTLANRFLTEIQGVIGTSDIYGEAHNALFLGYFANLKQFQQRTDFSGRNALRRLSRPHSLHLFVDPGILYNFFRLWLRKQNIDPDTVVHPDWEFRPQDLDSEPEPE
jgi:hypothetical protein